MSNVQTFELWLTACPSDYEECGYYFALRTWEPSQDGEDALIEKMEITLKTPTKEKAVETIIAQLEKHKAVIRAAATEKVTEVDGKIQSFLALPNGSE